MNTRKNVILITGGASGIGLALARAFIGLENKVIICGRNAQTLAQAKEKLPQLEVLTCDVSKAEDRQRLFDQIEQHYPKLNVVINNAAIQFNYEFSDLKQRDAEVQEEIAVNFTAPVTLTAKLLPLLLAQPTAAVINVSSALAIVPKQDAAIYCATKAAVHSYTKTLRYQFENTTLKVFEIIPPLVDTAMTSGRGTGKISPDDLAREAIRGIKADKYEIHIGKTKILFLLNRFLPSLAARILRNS